MADYRCSPQDTARLTDSGTGHYHNYVRKHGECGVENFTAAKLRHFEHAHLCIFQHAHADVTSFFYVPLQSESWRFLHNYIIAMLSSEEKDNESPLSKYQCRCVSFIPDATTH